MNKIPSATNMDFERFLSKINVLDVHACWEWTAGCQGDGYGQFRINGKDYLSHRVSFEWLGGDRADTILRHTCDNMKCCNPSHLLSGSQLDNIADREARGRTSKGASHSAAVAKGNSHYSRRRPELVARGSKHYASKLSDVLEAELKSDLAAGMSGADAARKYKISQGLVSMIRNGKIRKVPS